MTTDLHIVARPGTPPPATTNPPPPEPPAEPIATARPARHSRVGVPDVAGAVRRANRAFARTRGRWLPSDDGNSSDGFIARRQIAEVLVRSLTSLESVRKTFELVAETGPATTDFEAGFSALESDRDGSLDGILDTANMPLTDEP